MQAQLQPISNHRRKDGNRSYMNARLKVPAARRIIGVLSCKFRILSCTLRTSLLHSQHTTEMLELYESLTADCNQPLLPTKMLARFNKEETPLLELEAYEGTKSLPSLRTLTLIEPITNASIIIQLILPQIRGHFCPYMYSTRVDLEFSDLHSDESQSLAPRTSQPSLQGPTDRPQGLSIQ